MNKILFLILVISFMGINSMEKYTAGQEHNLKVLKDLAMSRFPDDKEKQTKFVHKLMYQINACEQVFYRDRLERPYKPFPEMTNWYDPVNRQPLEGSYKHN